jgi:hypothetical protein
MVAARMGVSTSNLNDGLANARWWLCPIAAGPPQQSAGCKAPSIPITALRTLWFENFDTNLRSMGFQN